jgi:hypothetical protein
MVSLRSKVEQCVSLGILATYKVKPIRPANVDRLLGRFALPIAIAGKRGESIWGGVGVSHVCSTSCRYLSDGLITIYLKYSRNLTNKL